MTNTEFNQWWKDYALRFPETKKWMDNQQSAVELLVIWKDVLANVNLADALEVNRQLTAGTMERWKSGNGWHDREETPAMIRKLCFTYRQSQGENREESPPVEEFTRTKRACPIGMLYTQLTAEGVTAADKTRIKAEFDAKYGVPQADDAGPRFRCCFCKDTGFVHCWDTRAIVALREGGILAVQELVNPVMGVLCSCARGDRSSGGSMGKWPRFNQETFYVCKDGDHRSEKNLQQFAKEYITARERNFSSRRTSDFDEYNNQG